MMDSVDFKTLKRPRSPNTYLVAPEGFCDNAEPDRSAGILPVPTVELFGHLRDLIGAEKNWSVTASDEERGLIRFVATSPLMRFKDDIDILVIPAEAGDPKGSRGSRLAIYSRSRVGHSDLGANRKRVEQILTNLNKLLIRT